MISKKTLTSFFGPNRTVYTTSAPGRMDVMGGIADYSGSLVLQMPIREQTRVYLSLRDDGRIRVQSLPEQKKEAVLEASFALNDLLKKNSQVDYGFAQKQFRQIPHADWAAYIVGCALVLIKERGAPFNGADFLVESHVPIGKGVSSSAALEVAVMAALSKALGIELGMTELPILAQKVENQIVGAPCGLMDQLACYLGGENRLLPIVCRPDLVSDPIEIPRPITFVGIDSGVRHAVSGASYSDVRIAAFMGYTIIALQEGASKRDMTSAKKSQKTARLPFQGYLTHISPSLFYRKYISLLPDKMKGSEFIAKYGDTIDSVTTIQPNTTYFIRNCAAHPIEENHRVETFAKLMDSIPFQKKTKKKHSTLSIMGELMLQSHSSYSRCGLGNGCTDELVDQAMGVGQSGGIYGAKITGGGSGGTVCILCEGQQGIRNVNAIAQRYGSQCDFPVQVFRGSSPGGRYKNVEKIRT